MEAMKEHGRKIPVMVMIAARDVADAIELGKHAKAQGCDAISSGGSGGPARDRPQAAAVCLCLGVPPARLPRATDTSVRPQSCQLTSPTTCLRRWSTGSRLARRSIFPFTSTGWQTPPTRPSRRSRCGPARLWSCSVVCVCVCVCACVRVPHAGWTPQPAQRRLTPAGGSPLRLHSTVSAGHGAGAQL